MNNHGYRRIAAVLLAGLLAGSAAKAQTTTIGGSVYGGGNVANVGGSTEVNVTGGQVENDVFGGGDQGVVEGSTKVEIKN